jgi:hypothetical protein
VVWKLLFDTEHANALISDGFWYIICKVFKKDKRESAISSDSSLPMLVAPDYNRKSNVNHHSYEAYQEFLLDRIAANYVSFTILED